MTLQIVDPYLGGDALSRDVASMRRTRGVYLAAVDPPGYHDVPQLEQSFALSPLGPIFQIHAR